jgi:hypothetical protein
MFYAHCLPLIEWDHDTGTGPPGVIRINCVRAEDGRISSVSSSNTSVLGSIDHRRRQSRRRQSRHKKTDAARQG